MSCKTNYGTTVETALKDTPGMTDAVVEFDERAVYVSGSAAVIDLVAAIQAVGCTATRSPHRQNLSEFFVIFQVSNYFINLNAPSTFRFL
jgi:copper chaperone CopZ